MLLLYSPSGIRIDSVQTIHDLSPDPFWDAGGWLWKYGPEIFTEEGFYSFHFLYRGEKMKTVFQYGSPLSVSKSTRIGTLYCTQDINGIRVMGDFDLIEVFDMHKRPLAFHISREPSGTRIIEQWPKGVVIFRIHSGNQIRYFKVLK